ncbi:MAG: hypothetical protein LQ337_002465 [Flavoplaca oasis]|nr:MAG: hypothetical protein LQ337_002465 [Flavoplaca oasis]
MDRVHAILPILIMPVEEYWQAISALSWFTVKVIALIPHHRSCPVVHLADTCLVSRNNASASIVSNEFAGLTLHCDKHRTSRNRFSVEQLAIASIAAMKEEALKDYTATVLEFDFTETTPVQMPFRIVMRAAQGAAISMLKRSTVMWAIRALATDLMRTRFLHPLLFVIKYHGADLYGGILAQPTGPPAHSVNPDMAVAPPLSLTNEINVLFQDTGSLQDRRQYEVGFQFLGSDLLRTQIFGAIMTTLLQLAPSDAYSVQPHVAVEEAFSAWIFMSQAAVPAPGYTFQLYHAVALLEAVARYYVSQQRYQEMVFELRTGEYIMATGCVTKGLLARRWCIFPEAENGPKTDGLMNLRRDDSVMGVVKGNA